mmetsp:Transcript_116774/g.227078  ORF Transcript_116774/g.227078 Transcript_116774/m.227078 type:complete len:349 (+) Transcript_116774:338-1384(+)
MLDHCPSLEGVCCHASFGKYLVADIETQWFRYASHDALRERLSALLHASTNEYYAVLSDCTLLPRLCERLIFEHVHTLNDEHFVLRHDVQYAFDAKKVLGTLFIADEGVQEFLKLVHVNRTLKPNAHVRNGIVHLWFVECSEFLLIHVLLFQHPCQVKSTNAEQLVHWHACLFAAEYVHYTVQLLDALLHTRNGCFIYKVDLVQEDRARECYLRTRSAFLLISLALVELFYGVHRVHQRDHIIYVKGPYHILIEHERLHHWCRIGRTREFHQNTIQLKAIFHLCGQVLQCLEQVTPDGAANAAIVQHNKLFCHILCLLLHKCIVDANLANLILDDGQLLVPLFLEHVV